MAEGKEDQKGDGRRDRDHDSRALSRAGDQRRYGDHDVKPSPYSLAKCKQRAETEPHLALTNAENYAQFASALRMEKHFF